MEYLPSSYGCKLYNFISLHNLMDIQTGAVYIQVYAFIKAKYSVKTRYLPIGVNSLKIERI